MLCKPSEELSSSPLLFPLPVNCFPAAFGPPIPGSPTPPPPFQASYSKLCFFLEAQW